MMWGWGITRWNVQQYVEMGERAWNDAFLENFWKEYALFETQRTARWIRLDHVIKKAVAAGPSPGLLTEFLQEVS